MNKQNVVYAYNGILFSLKKEGNSDMLKYGWGGRVGDATGRRYGDICICMAGSLCYTEETNTPLQSNYTRIKMLKQNVDEP